jgi:hypothetical protein
MHKEWLIFSFSLGSQIRAGVKFVSRAPFHRRDGN